MTVAVGVTVVKAIEVFAAVRLSVAVAHARAIQVSVFVAVSHS